MAGKKPAKPAADWGALPKFDPKLAAKTMAETDAKMKARTAAAGPGAIQSGGARAQDAANATAAARARMDKDNAGLANALKGGMGGKRRGRNAQISGILG